MEWHASGTREVLSALKSGEQGLSRADAAARLLRHGPNSIAIKKEISPLAIFLNQFRSLLVMLLLLAACVSLVLSIVNPEDAEIADALLIFAIVIANAFFGFFQEYKAERTMEELTKMAAPRATVIRDGKEVEIDASQVVPGDILLLGEGDKVAADARIIEAFSLYADESMLTGESAPVLKKNATLGLKTVLAERSNLAFMNSIITRGRGKAVVVETGLKTEMGKIAKEIADAPEKVTQFQVEIEDVGKKVSFITLGILAVIVATEFLMRTGDIFFIFITAVALGVAAIPEGLPAVVTLSLSIATNRMLQQKSLMRRLSTVQDLGSVNVICTDKTGTLTENVMTVRKMVLGGRAYDVSGTGTDIIGNIIPAAPKEDMGKLLRCAVLCNDAHQVGDGEKVFKGDPTEIAVLVPAYKAGMDVDDVRRRFRRVSEISFSAERKMMSTVNKDDGDGEYVFVKGAPEVVLSKCTHILSDGKERKLTLQDADDAAKHNVMLASHALRVLGFAYKKGPKSHDEKDVEGGLVFLGLMGMIDPPRPGVREAVEDCRSAGIRVIMVTGDNPHTAAAVGKELGFAGRAVTGGELDGLTDERISELVERVDIYARTSPKHKVMLLRALQRNGHVVCMTGDGVNDAAAIKNSDVGVAMGIRGTEVTKQASDMVVLDDNFISIRDAVSEGRGTFDNLRKFVAYLLGANIAEVLIIFLATIFSLGISSKIAIQLLWINLVTDGLPALALGVDPPAKNIMHRRPRKKGERVVNAPTLRFLVAIGLSATIAILAVYAHMLSLGDVVLAQTVLFTTFVLLEMLTVYVVRWKYGSQLFSNKWVHISIASSLILQFVVTYSPLNSFFGIVPLGIGEVEEIAAGMAIYLVLLFTFLKVEGIVWKRKA